MLGVPERAGKFNLGEVVGVKAGNVVFVSAGDRLLGLHDSRLSVTPAAKRSCACVNVCSARSTGVDPPVFEDQDGDRPGYMESTGRDGWVHADIAIVPCEIKARIALGAGRAPRQLRGP